ncbi:sensor domain-containing protein [Mycobacterium sp. Aquia_216]|uniref:sensor domain-containing protein n=1 Tax=Mycobacterium sp. Aquia_216 TaxID=2991729 RepID=UPI00227B0F27|nr:sensor domain-containing protein [Mycobacterium sp. Aquia_216]WAJ42980.1 sensor domain-containing protein [Mycobacterium sp. Aquia_216]
MAVVAGLVIARFSGNSDNRQATMNSTAPSTSSMPPVPITALDGMLASPADVAAALSAPPLVSLTKPADSHAFFGDEIADNNCVGVILAVVQSFYDGTGWVSMRRQELADAPDSAAIKYSVVEAVVAYQDAGAAAKFYQRAADRFHQCANRTLNVREVNVPNSSAAFEMVGQVSEKDGIVSTSLLWEGGDGRNCQRGVSVRNNVVIDVSDCGYNVPDAVVPALIKPIAAKIDTAR